MKRIVIGCLTLLTAQLTMADNGFSIDEFTIEANGEATVQIKMNNDVTFSGFQFDLELPEGVSIKLNKLNKPIVTATDRLKYHDDDDGIDYNHSINVSIQPSGKYRIMVYSDASLDIHGDPGDPVLSVKLVASDQVSTGTFTPKFTNIVMSQANETQYKPADCSYTCNITLSTPVTTLGYASFSWPKALDFTSSGLTAFIAKDCNGSSLRLVPVTKVPANTGLILKGTAGSENTYSLQTTDEETEDVSDNLLSSNTEDVFTVASNDIYVLSNLDNGQPGLYLASQGIHVGKYKSYLHYSGVNARMGLSFSEETTGIESVKTADAMSVDVVFDMQGRKVMRPSSGIYVRKGKKVVVR